MTADRTAREGLREALAEHLWGQSIYPNTYSLSWAEAVVEAESTPRSLVWHSVDLIRKNADDLLAGPLSDFLAAAEARAERMEAERDEASLDDRLRAAGMFTVAEMMGETPMTRWETHAGMTDLAAFDAWLDRKVAEYLRMSSAYAIGDRDKDDDLYEWVTAHSAAFRAIRTNFKAAIQAKTAGLTAEVEARDAVLRGLKAWIDTDLPAGTPGALVAHMAISKALTRTDQPEGTGSPAAAQDKMESGHAE